MKWFEKVLGFIFGAILLCCFSTLQKKAIGAPLVLKGYIVPVAFGGAAGFIISLWYAKLRKAYKSLQDAQNNLEIKVRERTSDLEKALTEIKTLKGILPFCSYCKKIRDDNGYWTKIEAYIEMYSDAEFSHSICKDCADKYYPDMKIYDD